MAAGGGAGGGAGAGAGAGAGWGSGWSGYSSDAIAGVDSVSGRGGAGAIDPRLLAMVDPSWGQVSEQGGMPWTDAATFAGRYGYNFPSGSNLQVADPRGFDPMRGPSADPRGAQAFGPAYGRTRGGDPFVDLNSYSPGMAGHPLTTGEYAGAMYGDLANDPALFDQLQRRGVSPVEVANEVQRGFINAGLPGNLPLDSGSPELAVPMANAATVLGRYGIGGGELGDVSPVEPQEQMGSLAAGPWSVK